MIAVATQSLALDKLPFGWFDFVIVAVLAFGLFRGRKNGMTNEVLPMLQWVATVLAAGMCYEMPGQFFLTVGGLNKMWSYILGYLVMAFLVYLGFVLIKKALVPRLTGSNFFGSSEYYLGTVSGMIRFFCILFFAMALLNAPYFTQKEILDRQKYVDRWYGSNYFPGIHDTQVQVFETSFLGRNLKQYAGIFLIDAAPTDADKQAQAASPAQAKPYIHIGN